MQGDSIPNQQPSYVDFVDGLRAVAILPVVLFHAGVAGLDGGFVGVDVFFVISGYLIIGQIVAAVERDKFSFGEFWSRRALRILPPYLIVILATAAAAPFVLVLPDEFKDFGDQVIWSAGMMVNHLFLMQAGYFDTAAETKPLLHLWSLAVEEQFYLVAPFIIVGLAALARRSATLPVMIVLALFAISFALCIRLSGSEINYAFYLMPLRAWEFTLGGAVPFAVPFLRRTPRWAVEATGSIGLAAILCGVLTFSAETPFPSFYAAIPTCGAALVIAAGVSGRPLTATLLSAPPLRWIGLLSYSWYLWHWPILAMARQRNWGDLPLWLGLACVGVAFLLAVATWLVVEKPIRELRRRFRIDRGWRAAGIGLAACFVAIAAALVTTPVMVSQAKAGLTALGESSTDYPTTGCALNRIDTVSKCVEAAKGRRFGLLIGDSHARALWHTIDEAWTAHGGTLATVMGSGCVALFDTQKYSRGGNAIRSECVPGTQRAKGMIADLKPEFAIVASRWLSIADGNSDRQQIGPVNAKPAANQKRFFVNSLRATLTALIDDGVKSIFVIAPTPEFARHPTSCVARADRYGQSRDTMCSASRASVVKDRRKAVSWLKAAVKDLPGVKLIDPINLVCDETLCRPYDAEAVLFRDPNHYNDTGAAYYFGRVRSLAWLFDPPEN